jgi:hypothetical protein
MSSVNPGYVSTLEARDIRRYPHEIAKIPERDSMAVADPDRGLTFSQIAAGIADETRAVATAGASSRKAQPDRPFTLWEKDKFGLGDFVDIINPLQHIPIVATVYRNMTGDKIGFAPRVIGGALWGKIGGFVSGVVNAVVDWFTGKDIGDHIFSALFGPTESGNGMAVAQSVHRGDETSAPQPEATPIGLKQPVEAAPWNNPFMFEDRFAELTGHLTVPSVTSAVQSARPAIPSAPTKLSALDSYGRNAAMEDSAVNSKFSGVA